MKIVRARRKTVLEPQRTALAEPATMVRLMAGRRRRVLAIRTARQIEERQTLVQGMGIPEIVRTGLRTTLSPVRITQITIDRGETCLGHHRPEGSNLTAGPAALKIATVSRDRARIIVRAIDPITHDPTTSDPITARLLDPIAGPAAQKTVAASRNRARITVRVIGPITRDPTMSDPITRRLNRELARLKSGAHPQKIGLHRAKAGRLRRLRTGVRQLPPTRARLLLPGRSQGRRLPRSPGLRLGLQSARRVSRRGKNREATKTMAETRTIGTTATGINSGSLKLKPQKPGLGQAFFAAV